MKHKASMILVVAIILSLLNGCGAVGKQASTVAEAEKETVLTVRIVNQSTVNLYGIAVSYSANDETLGSKVCERIDKNADQVVYEFSFVPNELLATPIDSFRLDVFAAGKASEDYSDCGSAVIKSPQLGGVYTLALNGEDAAALTLSTAEQEVEIFPLCRREQICHWILLSGRMARAICSVARIEKMIDTKQVYKEIR